jgi:ubiquitin C-terminal hydrolase
MKKFVLNTNLPEEFGSEEFGDQVNINEELMYDLYGICNHHGNLGSGHYTAYCKNPKFEKWYEFNDDQVKEVQNL